MATATKANVVLLVATALAAEAAGAEPALVRKGRAEAVIVVASAASPDEKLAAQELQEYVRRISGATLPIGPVAGPARSQVRIGVFGSEPVGTWKGEQPPRDGFVLSRQGNTLLVVGGDARGALYGIYDLLEVELGVRWFMPGEMGEDVPISDTLLFPRSSRRGAPAFNAVGGFIWAGGPGAAVWERRMRARVGPVSAFFGHNWENIIPPTAANKQSHPAWFALNAGERTNQLCSAEPDVLRITVEKAREFFAKNPAAEVFSISPNDGYGFCDDDRCQAVDRKYGVTDGSLTDRFVDYANRVLDELSETHPDKQVGILAYVQHTRPPVSAKPHPNYVTLITHMPWEFCHVHAMEDPACALNRRFAEYVRGWTRAAHHVGVYDYYGHFYMFTPWPIVHSIRRDIPFLQSLGVDRFMSETQQNWANQGLNFYVAAKLAWKPGLDVDALLQEYYRRFYGRAAGPMQRYWEGWERAMVATGAAGDGGYRWLAMFTPELIQQSGRLLDEAEIAAAQETAKVQARVGFARKGFRFTEARTRMRGYADRQDWAAALAASQEAVARIKETAGSEPQAFYIDLALSQMEAATRAYREGRAATP